MHVLLSKTQAGRGYRVKLVIENQSLDVNLKKPLKRVNLSGLLVLINGSPVNNSQPYMEQ